MATSEMNRGAYRSIMAAEQSNDMAAAAESRAIEYSGRVLLALRSVKGEADMVEVGVTKNKHGPSGDVLYLRGSRSTMKLAEAPAPMKADGNGNQNNRDKVTADAAHVADALADNQAITVNDLHSEMRARHGSFSEGRVAAGLRRPGKAVRTVDGARGSKHQYLDGPLVPPDVIAKVPPAHKAKVIAAHPPLTSG